MLDTTPAITGDPWGALGAMKYGMDPIQPSGGREHIPHVASTGNPAVPVWSPQHPLFWFGVILAATGFGFFGISGSVKVANTKVSGAVGEA